MRRFTLALLTAAPLALTGCEMLGIETAATVAKKREAEGRAIGAACRHSARSIEQCHTLNRRADKAAVFAGWREMNDYMRENSIEPMPATAPAGDVAAVDEAEATERSEPRAARRSGS
jgi:hypothetical protein